MPRHYKCRTDSNQAAIAASLRSFGCLVFPLHTVGHGMADLLVKLPTNQLVLVEVKTEKGKLTDDQERLISQGWPVVILRSPDEAQALVSLSSGSV